MDILKCSYAHGQRPDVGNRVTGKKVPLFAYLISPQNLSEILPRFDPRLFGVFLAQIGNPFDSLADGVPASYGLLSLLARPRVYDKSASLQDMNCSRSGKG